MQETHTHTLEQIKAEVESEAMTTRNTHIKS